MATLGTKQTFTACTIPATTSGPITKAVVGQIIVNGVANAIAVLLRFSGSASGDLLVAAGAQLFDFSAGGVAANATGLSLVGTGFATAKVNGVAPDGGYVLLTMPTTLNSQYPIPLPSLAVTGAIANTQVTDVTIEVWPIFAQEARPVASSAVAAKSIG